MPATRGPSSLPIADWPAADRSAWLSACKPPVRLSPGGAASRMSRDIQQTNARAYGHFLAYCRREGALDADTPAAVMVTPDRIAAFLADLSHLVGSVTRLNYIQRILRVASILSPDRDFGWLREVVADLKDSARPRPKAHRIVDSDRLLSLGLALIRRGEESTDKKPLVRARLIRDGLMVVLLCLCPIRLKNFAALHLERQIRRIDGVWWIMLTAPETKSRRPDERPLPAFLTELIDRWVQFWRPLFPSSGDAFWPSTTGGPLGYAFVSQTITEVTKRELGVAVSPHLFRDCAVYTIANNAGDRMGMASALLQHTDPRVTQKHYNKGSMHSAVKGFQVILRSIADGRG
jgi:integrase